MQNRIERLENDFKDMMKLQDRPYLSWIATKGELPYAEEYLLDIRLKSYALRVGENGYVIGAVDHFFVTVTLYGSYPEVAPNIRMLNIPSVFHPAWYSMGTYCPPTNWSPQRTLKDFVTEMLKTLMYLHDATYTETPANYKALNWYAKHMDDPELFPSDDTELSENSDEVAAEKLRSALSFDTIIDTRI